MGPSTPRPFEASNTARFIDERIDQLKSVKSQREIAYELGYGKPNILSMIRHGETKLPLDKVPALAKAIDADPAHLLRMALEDYLPALAATVAIVFGRVATENEWAGLLEPWREATRNSDPSWPPDRVAALRQFLREIRVETPPKGLLNTYEKKG